MHALCYNEEKEFLRVYIEEVTKLYRVKSEKFRDALPNTTWWELTLLSVLNK